MTFRPPGARKRDACVGHLFIAPIAGEARQLHRVRDTSYRAAVQGGIGGTVVRCLFHDLIALVKVDAGL